MIAGGGSREMAVADGKTQTRSVRSDQPKAMPARQMFGCLLKQPVIEMSKDIAAEFAASLGEGLFTDATAQGILAGSAAEN